MRIKVGNRRFPYVREVDFVDMEGDIHSESGVLEVSGGGGSGAPSWPVAVGEYVDNGLGSSVAISSASMGTVGMLMLSPLYIPFEAVDRIGISTAAVGDATLRIGWYPMNDDGSVDWANPVDGGVMTNLNSGIGLKEKTIAQNTPGGKWVWSALLTETYTSAPQLGFRVYNNHDRVLPGTPCHPTSGVYQGKISAAPVATGSFPTVAPTMNNSAYGHRCLVRGANPS